MTLFQFPYKYKHIISDYEPLKITFCFMKNLGLYHPGCSDKFHNVYAQGGVGTSQKAPRSLGNIACIISNLGQHNCKILDTVMKGRKQGCD